MATSRQSQIRAVLTNDYRQGASNDALIARYQAEMRTLVHRHEYPLVKLAIALGVPVTVQVVWAGARQVSEPLHVYVNIRNDDGDRMNLHAVGDTVDEAINYVLDAARLQTHDDSWVMNDWRAE